jgi:hypothetical protein
MFQLYAFNQRGQRLRDERTAYGQPPTYTAVFAQTEDYSTIRWCTSSALSGIRSGYRYSAAHAGLVRNRIAYFEVYSDGVLIARIRRFPGERASVFPVVDPAQPHGHGSYDVVKDFTDNNRPSWTACHEGRSLGTFEDARDAYAACRTHYEARSVSLPLPIGNGLAVLAVEESATPGWHDGTWSSPLVVIGADPSRGA